jgi:hypothetical protein
LRLEFAQRHHGQPDKARDNHHYQHNTGGEYRRQ